MNGGGAQRRMMRGQEESGGGFGEFLSGDLPKKLLLLLVGWLC